MSSIGPFDGVGYYITYGNPEFDVYTCNIDNNPDDPWIVTTPAELAQMCVRKARKIIDSQCDIDKSVLDKHYGDAYTYLYDTLAEMSKHNVSPDDICKFLYGPELETNCALFFASKVVLKQIFEIKHCKVISEEMTIVRVTPVKPK